MYKAATFFFLFFLVNVPGRTQLLNYVHYDTKDGLAGSTVYGVTQDKDGFLWFATDFGVSRFDGKRFKNFTTDDGLPDNEILNIAADSTGRVWIMPFNGHACYYYHGKIFTERTDSILKKINSFGAVGSIGPYKKDAVCVSYKNIALSIILYKNDSLYLRNNLIDFKEKLLASEVFTPLGLKKQHEENIAIVDGNVYRYVEKENRTRFLKSLPDGLRNSKLLLFNRFVPDSFLPIKYFAKYNYISEFPEVPDSIVGYINSKQGCYPVSWNATVAKEPYLPGKNISKTIRDVEGNLWFTTLGDGVYKLITTSMKTYGGNKEIFSLVAHNKNVFAGDYNGILYNIFPDGKYSEESFPFNDSGNTRRLYFIKALPDGQLLLGFDCFLLKKNEAGITFAYIRPIKAIDYIDEQYIAVSTNIYTFKVRTKDMRIVDTLYYDRATRLLYFDGKYYFGTLNGLVVVDERKQTFRMGDKLPLLNSRITDICKAPGNSLFIATNDNGVIKYDKKNITGQFTVATGLSSNICRSLYCDDQTLWVGTNKGLNKVNLQTGKVEAQYTIANGLPSDIINTIYVEGSTVWVGTPGGLTYFNEQEISNNSICNLVMERIIIDGRSVDTGNNLALNWRRNNISFEFSGISMKAAGDITYHYRLIGLDNDWKETKLNTLAYPSLPSGKYTLEIYAMNKFGRQSKIIAINFSIATPFWKTTLFWVFIILALAGIIILLLNRRYRQNLRRRDEKNRIAREISEARQQALQAQMNPHFVFNCLNSIQQFIMLNEKEKANKYLTEFADLIRKTLENSDKKNITVAEEIAYLRQYLEMEQLRYGDAFDFNIKINEGLQEDFTEIPAMLLQPYIENSLRHGIRHKTNGKGLIELLFLQENDLLTCVVRDNGIGRAAAQKMKSAQHIEYQSKGMALTARRIELLNTQANAGIKVLVNDVQDDAGAIAGTEVTIQIPLK